MLRKGYRCFIIIFISIYGLDESGEEVQFMDLMNQERKKKIVILVKKKNRSFFKWIIFSLFFFFFLIQIHSFGHYIFNFRCWWRSYVAQYKMLLCVEYVLVFFFLFIFYFDDKPVFMVYYIWDFYAKKLSAIIFLVVIAP